MTNVVSIYLSMFFFLLLRRTICIDNQLHNQYLHFPSKRAISNDDEKRKIKRDARAIICASIFISDISYHKCEVKVIINIRED